MFVLFFAIFIFLCTVFENIFIVLTGFVICVLVIFLTKRRKYCVVCIFAFLLAIGSVFLYNFRHNQWLYGPSTSWLSTVFIGTGQILDRQWQGKYLVDDWKFTYILVSKKDYQAADKIRLVGNIKMTKSTFETKSLFLLPSSTSLSWLFHYEFNYDKRLKMKWINGTVFEQNSIPLKDSYVHNAFITFLRNWLQNLVKRSYWDGKTAGLILGMLIGDKSQIPPSDYQSFVDSGLVHLIAVSGGNIIMIVIFLGCILFLFPFYVRNGVILICIILYGFLCGMDSSVFRAVIMWGLGMIALFRWRQLDIRHSLSIAFIGMLLYNPYYLVYDVGFLFSFSAIIGLVYFWNILQLPKESSPKNTSRGIAQIKIWHNYIIKNYLSPSIWATLGIVPTMIFFMGKVNLLSVVGNLFVLPIVPFVMIYGFISTILYQIFPRSGYIRIEERLIHYIYWISEQIWKFWRYMNVEGDRIKYLILMVAISRFIQKQTKRRKREKEP